MNEEPQPQLDWEKRVVLLEGRVAHLEQKVAEKDLGEFFSDMKNWVCPKCGERANDKVSDSRE